LIGAQETSSAPIETGSMRAAILEAPGRTSTIDLPVPTPGHGQVRVRVEGCGVCASNLSPWHGQPWFTYPFPPGAPGHEGWGVIDSIGDGVEGVRPGVRVAFLSGNAFAEYDLAAADQIVPLPASLRGSPFPGEPLGCAFNILRRSRIEAGDVVAVVGAGFIGAVLTRLATSAGARVIAISRRDHSLEVARQFGAAGTVRMDDHHAVIDRVRQLTDDRLCDRTIECAGAQWPLDLAAELTRERGTLVIAGYHQDGPRQVDMQLWNWRGLDVVNAHERDPAIYVRGIRDALEAVTAGDLDPSPLYTHTYPLERLADALDAARDRPAGFVKALVIP
jgi:threonine dehydrogenase-like Zn-dependent dehydrogenase